MQFIEQSQKIRLTKDVSLEEIKARLLDRLHSGFQVVKAEEKDNEVLINAFSTGAQSWIKNTAFTVTIRLEKTQEVVRVIVSGKARVATSLALFYSLLFMFVLLAGLLPGAIETSADSGAGDVLIFVIFGLFIFYDTHKKLQEPAEYIDSILQSLDTEYG